MSDLNEIDDDWGNFCNEDYLKPDPIIHSAQVVDSNAPKCSNIYISTTKTCKSLIASDIRHIVTSPQVYLQEQATTRFQIGPSTPSGHNTIGTHGVDDLILVS